MKCLSIVVLFAAICLCLSCPNGWYTHNSKCYHFSRETETWPDALTMCQVMKGQLVEIDDIAENTFLETQAKQLGLTYWMALSDVEEEGTWVWVNSGKHITSESFTDWASGQPNNYNKTQHCAIIYRSLDFHWNDDYCHNSNNYICERDNSAQIIG